MADRPADRPGTVRHVSAGHYPQTLGGRDRPYGGGPSRRDAPRRTDPLPASGRLDGEGETAGRSGRSLVPVPAHRTQDPRRWRAWLLPVSWSPCLDHSHASPEEAAEHALELIAALLHMEET